MKEPFLDGSNTQFYDADHQKNIDPKTVLDFEMSMRADNYGYFAMRYVLNMINSDGDRVKQQGYVKEIVVIEAKTVFYLARSFL